MIEIWREHVSAEVAADNQARKIIDRKYFATEVTEDSLAAVQALRGLRTVVHGRNGLEQNKGFQIDRSEPDFVTVSAIEEVHEDIVLVAKTLLATDGIEQREQDVQYLRGF